MTDAEQRLFAFGPFGVSVCDGPYGIFKWQKQNVTVIELTERCIKGTPGQSFGFFKLRSRLGGSSFEISYDSIVSAELLPHPARLGLMQVLDIKYHEGERISEKSIASYNDRMEKSLAIIQRHAPRGATRPDQTVA
jgi:hypothetical protein